MIEEHINKKQITVFVSGLFNILHPGHLRLLRFAKGCGTKLIVGIESDKNVSNNYQISEDLRLEGILSNSLVDEAFIIKKSLEDYLLKLKPDIVVKGKEHELSYNIEQNIISKYGGRLIFSSGESIFSSYDLIKNEFNEFAFQSIKLPNEYINRHGINLLDLKNFVHNFSKLKICVIGDLIIDEYITCEPLGMSQEDPTIVVTPIKTQKYIGGAAIVAAHAASLGAQVEFISVTGSDELRNFTLSELSTLKIIPTLLIDDTRPTTLKKRYRCKGKTMLRVSTLHQDHISIELQKEILNKITNIAPNINLLVFSDFNYGVLPQELVDKIIDITNKNPILLTADSQSSSQIGDISRFRKMDLITPTEKEARISTKNNKDGLVVLADNLRKIADVKNIFLTLGEEGVLIHSYNDKKCDYLTDRIEALNKSPKDISGAGDSMLIASSLILASGGNIWEAALLGSLASAIQVSRIGNVPIQIKELIKELE